MFRSRFLWKLFAGYALLILVALALVGGLVAKRIETETLSEIDRRLSDSATLLRALVAKGLAGSDPDTKAWKQALQEHVGPLGAQIDIRLTVVRKDGLVIADSQEDAERMENHANRPEIILAYEQGLGISSRFSNTQGRNLRYLAMPIEHRGRPFAAVRTALPIDAVQARLADLRYAVLSSAFAALLLALGLGFLHARRVTRPLLSMAEAAERIAGGRYDQRVEAYGHDELGKLARAFNTMSRELEASVAAIASDRNKLSAILAGMAEGVVAVDRDERIVHINEVAGRLLDADPNSVTSHPIWAATRLHDISEILGEAMQRNQVSNRILRLPGVPDRILELRAAPLVTNEQLAGAVLVIQDVTQLRRLETVRQDFVGNVSHELKTPVTAIRGMVETLLDDPDSPEHLRTRFLERVITQADRMGNLVNDLLSLSRLESESGVFEIGPIDLRQPVRESVRLLQPASEAKQVTIDCRIPEKAVLVDGDEEGLRQAVSNLLDNAIKYSPEGSVVDVRICTSEDTTTIEVEDRGVGIASHHQGRLFERFYRVDKARSRALGGTGLGLAIVKHTVLAHGGDVSVDSIPGRGSIFRIELPLGTSFR